MIFGHPPHCLLAGSWSNWCTTMMTHTYSVGSNNKSKAPSCYFLFISRIPLTSACPLALCRLEWAFRRPRWLLMIKYSRTFYFPCANQDDGFNLLETTSVELFYRMAEAVYMWPSLQRFFTNRDGSIIDIQGHWLSSHGLAFLARFCRIKLLLDQILNISTERYRYDLARACRAPDLITRVSSPSKVNLGCTMVGFGDCELFHS
jgi:hypothetical protein